MIRTQIYLTEAEKEVTKSLSVDTGQSQSEIIRQAISAYLKELIFNENNSAFGIWKDNEIDIEEMRKNFDRKNND